MKRIIFLIFFCCIAQLSQAQEDVKPTRQQRKAEQKKEQQKKLTAKAEEKGIKHHIAIQSKDVKKRMKRNRKRYDHVDSFDRRPNFIQRLFHRKRPSAY